jgi:hypothetical protein
MRTREFPGDASAALEDACGRGVFAYGEVGVGVDTVGEFRFGAGDGGAAAATVAGFTFELAADCAGWRFRAAPENVASGGVVVAIKTGEAGEAVRWGDRGEGVSLGAGVAVSLLR